MEMSEVIVLSGAMGDVLRDASRLQELLKELPTFVGNKPSSAVQDGAWPHYENRVLKFGGLEAEISERQHCVLQPLLDAGGGVVPREVLEKPFLEDGISPNELNVNVSRLRSVLAEKFGDKLTIETIGTGYRLVA